MRYWHLHLHHQQIIHSPTHTWSAMKPVVYCFLLIVVFIFCTGPASAQDNPNVDNTLGLTIPGSLPPQNSTGVNTITTADGYDNFELAVTTAEPHMSTNPLNPLAFFNAFNINSAFRTTDGGGTWAASGPNFGTSPAGDPVTAYDSLGNLYYETMYGSISGCKVIRSTDNGATWSTAATSIAGVDKNWMAADQTSGPNANYLYTTMTASSGGNFARSTDFGATWTNTWNASTQSLPGMMVAVGPNVAGGNNISGGCVYVVTHSGTNAAGIYTFYVSTDGGVTFTQKSTNQFSNVIGTEVSSRSTVQGMRCRPYPFIASDNSYGPNRGRLYLVYASNFPAGSGNKSDVFLRYSTDQGTTWSAPATVNDDPNTQNNFQFHPAIWCDKETGRLYIQFYDTRNVPTSDSMDVYATYTDDGGLTFAQNQRVTNQRFKINFNGGTPPVYRGDYNSITSNRYTSMAVWTDFRSNSYLGMTGYFPDFALIASPASVSMRLTDSVDIRVKVPSVKLYTSKVKFTASVAPAGAFTFSFVGGKDSLLAYPDSVTLRIKTTSVLAGTYTVTVTGSGPNGTPVHRRNIAVDVNTTANTVTVTSPNGGETWETGSLHTLSWVRTGVVDSVKIEYSTNNGSQWIVVTNGVPGTPSTYSWAVPNTPSTQALVRMSWTDSNAVSDVSNAVFTITPATFPVITTAPDSIVASLQVGGTTSSTLTIGNTGTANLNWSISESGSMAARMYTPQRQADELYPNWFVGKGEADRYHGYMPAERDTVVGPDSAGYRAIDSDSPGGPVFQWFNTDSVGTAITDWTTGGGTADDGYAVVALPWPFQYYGADYSSIKIVTNGWAGFQTTSTNTAYSNSAIPSTAEPNLALYPFWDDLNLTSAGSVKYYNDVANQRFIIQWTAVPHYSSGGPYTFQIQLKRNGEILYQYLSMTDPLNSATIGIENGSGTVAVQLVYSNNYLHNNLAIRFSRGLSWVEPSPTTGTTTPGGSTPVTVSFNAAGLTAGTYRGALLVTSNDLAHSSISIPVRLSVTTTGVDDHNGDGLPNAFAVDQNYPNPFNPSTTIRYALPAQARVTLKVYNMLGQEVTTLVNTLQAGGYYTAVWNGTTRFGSHVSSGVYTYRLDATGVDGKVYSIHKKMLLLK
jgi:hypothetical protein